MPELCERVGYVPLCGWFRVIQVQGLRAFLMRPRQLRLAIHVMKAMSFRRLCAQHGAPFFLIWQGHALRWRVWPRFCAGTKGNPEPDRALSDYIGSLLYFSCVW